jgi:tetratricopeptide (TPR) repeat protein
MTKNYETGHARNVENFRKLNEHIVSFGSKYAPSDVRLQVANLNTVRTTAEASLNGINAANPPFLQAVNRRETAFVGIPQLASRALHLAETLHLDAVAIKALKELVRKLYGRRATPKKEAPAPEGPDAEETEDTEQKHKYISVSQLSFDQRIEHFDQFIEILKAEPAYQPAEADLNIAGLSARLAEMRAANDAVTQAGILLTNARNVRNTVLYTPITGLVGVALDVKKYVRAALGSDSGEYREIKNLEFTKIKV